MNSGIPEPITTLDLRSVRAVVVEGDERELVLVIYADGVAIELSKGVSGLTEQAILGAERIAGAAGHYAELLRVRAGSRAPFPPPAPGETARVEPPSNLGQPPPGTAW